MTAAPETPRPVTPVSILAARLAAVARELARDEARDPALTEEVRRLAELATGLDPYTARMTSPESPALASLSRRTSQEDWSRHGEGLRLELGLEQEMLSGHLEGRLLRMLVQATRARRVLEVGMFTGYSALAMAEALPAGGRVVACEIEPSVARLAQESFAASPAGRLIEVRVGPALTTLAALAEDGEEFDLVFLDADKAGYTAYVHTLLERGLLAADGLLVVDNTLMQGQPWTSGETSANARAIAAFNQVLADDPRVEQVLLPVRDGITLARRVSP